MQLSYISNMLVAIGSFSAACAGLGFSQYVADSVMRGGSGVSIARGGSCSGAGLQNCPTSKGAAAACTSSVSRCVLTSASGGWRCAEPPAIQTCTEDPNCEQWAYQECRP
jgi:hypothetical protein